MEGNICDVMKYVRGGEGGWCEASCNNVSICGTTVRTGSTVQSSEMLNSLNILNWRRALQYAAAITGQFEAGTGQYTVQVRNIIV
jgi:hypothetical protein